MLIPTTVLIFCTLLFVFLRKEYKKNLYPETRYIQLLSVVCSALMLILSIIWVVGNLLKFISITT